ncbi:MAG: hypothetical protein LQ338_003222 [Usnochroma carphineum]|nr:MAG: hypothetical protein LQ338_003222 [Usnochroma carphineum]
MPADYNSTAQALALPVSPPDSPTQTYHQPRWSRQRGSGSLSRNRASLAPPDSGLRDKVFTKLDRLGRATLRKFSPLQLALASVLGLLALIATILFFIYHEKFFSWLEPTAVKWKNLRGGWCILWAMTFMTAFPPIVGYSTCFTLAGFVYGLPEGWLIISTATVAGSTCSFFTSRTIFSGFVHRLVANDKRFEAFSSVLRRDGLKLLIMIRLCPLPYSISNGAISTFPTVTPQMFVIATSVMTLKLTIPIFIGTRLAAIAKSGEKMDASTKAINWISIVGGVILGLVTGWLIYKRTVARARELESEEQTGSRQPGQRAGEFSDDPDEHAATATLLRDDQIDFRYDQDGARAYRDEATDDEDDVFRFGDGDEEGSIGLDKHAALGR